MKAGGRDGLNVDCLPFSTEVGCTQLIIFTRPYDIFFCKPELLLLLFLGKSRQSSATQILKKVRISFQ